MTDLNGREAEFVTEHPELTGHHVGDDCLARHYWDTSPGETSAVLLCGQDFMAGTICSDLVDHENGHSATCVWCGGDWVLETCECPTRDDDDSGDET